MSDLSSMSDADLQALYSGGAPTAPAPQASPLTGMSDADLQALHAKASAADHPVAGSTGSMLTDFPRQLGTGVANAAAGFLSLPNTVAQGIDKVGQIVGGQPWAQKTIEQIPGGNGEPLFPDFQTAKNMAFKTTGGTEYQPETWLGRRTQDVINGVAAGGPAQLLTVGPRAAAESLPALIGGSATGGQAAETFPEHPMAAATLGAIPGMAVGNAAMNAPQRIGAMIGGGANTEPYGAFARLGLPTDLAGTTTGAALPTYAEKLAARMPGSEAAVAEARGNLTDAWQNKLNDVASGMGKAATPTEAGVSLQSATKDWLDNFKTQSSGLWNNYYGKVPPSTPYPVTNYEAALNKTLGQFPGAPQSGAILQPGTLKGLSDALGVDLKASGGTLPAETVHNMRTAIGEKLDNPTTIADTSQAALRQLYGGLTEDIKSGAASVSPDALTAFHRANGYTAAGHDLLDNQLGPILKAPTPEQATQYVMSQARLGGSRLGAVTFNLPGAAGDLRSYALQNAATNTQSPTSLATAITGRKPIYSPEAQQVLFGHDPAVQQNVSDLAATGNAMKPMEKDLNNSPTATHEARGLGRIYSAVELGKLGHEMAGVPGAVAGAGAGLFAPQLMGRVAQSTALSPWLAALYGKDIPMPAQNPSLMARAIMAPTLGPRSGAPGVPATYTSSGQQ